MTTSRESFAYEWGTKYVEHGHRPEDRAHEEMMLLRYTSKTYPSWFKGKTMLDAGCGNGRYARIAADWGAKVTAYDFPETVKVAAANLQGHPNVTFVGGSLEELPFPDGAFDFVTSIGVLHHSQDARANFLRLAKKVKPGGAFSVYVYGRGNPIKYHVNHILRNKVAKLFPSNVLWYLCYIPTAIGKVLHAVPYLGWAVHELVLKVVFISHQHHDNFDTYSAGWTSFHTPDEVASWYREAGFIDIVMSGSSSEIYGFGRRPGPGEAA